MQKDPQLVLLDLKLPFFNGFHWCEEIRKISQVPVMFLSSAADNMNMVMAMSRGADDFIAKPFDLDVLTAKVQAVLRRTYAFGQNNSLLGKGRRSAECLEMGRFQWMESLQTDEKRIEDIADTI